jgi:hypothetical protein
MLNGSAKHRIKGIGKSRRLYWLQTMTSQGKAQYKLAKAQAKQHELEAEAGLAWFSPPIAAVGVAIPIAANNNDDGEAMDVC